MSLVPLSGIAQRAWIPLVHPDFERVLVQFPSPDGKSTRMFITHQPDPATVEGISRVDSERSAAQDALKMTSLSDAKIFLVDRRRRFPDQGRCTARRGGVDARRSAAGARLERVPQCRGGWVACR